MRLLTLARDLHRRKSRERHNLFLAEGTRAVEELAASGLAVRGVLVSPALSSIARGQLLRERLAQAGHLVQEISDAELESAAGTESPQGVLAIAEAPSRTLEGLEHRDTARYLVLDGLQDPGNAGTLLRTAAAFAVDATLLLPGTVDVWNAKVVRSAVGALFRHPPVRSTWPDFAEFLRVHEVALWGADSTGRSIDELEPPARLAIAIGNEGGGLSEDARRLIVQKVAIPIAPDVESLNAAVAGGILLHQFRV